MDVSDPHEYFIDRCCDIYVIILWLQSEKYKIMYWKKIEFEDLQDLLVYFKFYFVIPRDGSFISNMYFLHS
jgi:hypothetical protein